MTFGAYTHLEYHAPNRVDLPPDVDQDKQDQAEQNPYSSHPATLRQGCGYVKGIMPQNPLPF